MKKYLVILAAAFACISHAAVPPAEKLLPSDTILLLTTPDMTQYKGIFSRSPQGQLWNDPAMRPFREDVTKRLNENVLAPLEKELGIKVSDYAELAQGQVTFAFIRHTWTKTNGVSSFLFLVDTKDKQDQARTQLEDLKKRWKDSGKNLKTETIQNVEFVHMKEVIKDVRTFLKKAYPNLNSIQDDEEEEDEKQETKEETPLDVYIGLSDSLLIIGDTAEVLEKVLIKKSGGLVTGLAEDPAYEATHNALFRGAAAYGWLNIAVVNDIIKEIGGKIQSDDPFAPKAEKILSAVGLDGLKNIGLSYQELPEGGMGKVFMNVPASDRKGLLKILAPETKESGPLPYIPADVAKFNRYRVDLQKFFAGLESMVTEIMPPAAGVFNLIFESAGKDKDPNFDLRTELFGNLGDDMVVVQKPARGSSLQEMNSQPTLYLVGSANPDKLAHAIQVVFSSLGQNSFKEREFLGRKVYSLNLPASPAEGGPKGLHFSSSGGYLALSADVAFLEEFLRSSEFKGKPLSETAGLSEAIQKVGGLNTGLFGYENQALQARTIFEMLKANPNLFGALTGSDDDDKESDQWVDFSLLPAFDAVSKYFHFNVYAGRFDADGFHLNIFVPTPPLLKK